MKKRLFALLLVLCMLVALCAGCGESGKAPASSAPETAEEPASAPETVETPAEEPSSEEPASAEEAVEENPNDFTAANASMDFTGYKEMLKGLTTELPITEEPVTLSYFLGFEGSTLNYIEGGTLDNHQVWTWLEENTGVSMDLRVVDKANEGDQFNLMIASGDYADIIPAADFTTGLEAAYEEEIVVDLSDMLEEYMPNYWTIVNSDQNLLSEVKDSDMFLGIYAIKDQVANPSGMGTFVRKDWLEDLGMEVPQTYDELTEVLKAFKTEKGATEPMSIYNTVSLNNGLLIGGFGALAELSPNDMGTDFANSFYQEDGKVIYGATAEGTRKYLSWLNELCKEGLISMDNMQAREMNPFSEYNAGEAASGATGYMFNMVPFGGMYSAMSADTNCNWWPVQDVAETAGQTIPFFEEVSLIDMTAVSITTACDELEVAMQFLDFGYSYEGSLLYNFGFQKGSGEGIVETWDFDADGEPLFDGDALKTVAEATNVASGVISTKDLAGVVFDKRLSFEFGERELSCFDAWSTNKSTENMLGSRTTLTAEESTEASAIYSDILTYVATSALQFINGDLNINDDAVWNDYVSKIEDMGVAELTDIIQAAYDRANG